MGCDSQFDKQSNSRDNFRKPFAGIVDKTDEYDGRQATSPVQQNKSFETKELKDSGTRQAFSSGAVRDAQENKGRFDLLPFWPLFGLSCIFESGAKKYAANNWRKGMPISRYVDSAERHLQKFKAGFRDEPHLWQAFWNICCAIHTQVQVAIGIYPAEYNDLYSDFTPDGKAELLCDFEKKRIGPLVGKEL